jgi:XTP/dITP diphosphohydrolase
MSTPEPPLQRAVQVMDRLRSPGGCPWDAAQTHESLTRYLLEEAYEVIEAIETGDRALLREELGDLLLQVLFHARIEQEATVDPFGIDDVAEDLVEKLVRRHPHVFGDAVAGTADELNEVWERQKVEEKGRGSAVDGVPVNQPALSLAAKLISRARRAGFDVPVVAIDDDELGARLFALVAEAVTAGLDPEAVLRQTARRYRAAVRAAEKSGAEKKSGR